MAADHGWPTQPLGTVTELLMGQAPPSSATNTDGKGLPLIAGAGDFSARGLAASKYTEQARRVSEPNDVIVSICATIGPHRRADGNYALGRGVAALRASEDVEVSYLSHFVSHAAPALQLMGRGATFLQISRKDLAEFPIPLPPLPEQRRIAKILDKSSGNIEQVSTQQESLDALQINFVERLLSEKERESISLSKLAEIQSGITKGRKLRGDQELFEHPYLAVSNVKDGFLDLNTVSTIPVTSREVERFKLFAGDILLTEGGDPDKLGRGTVWQEEVPSCLHQNHIFRVRLPKDSKLPPVVLMALIASRTCRAYFLRSAKQTTGIASINKTQLSGLPVPILDKAEVDKLKHAISTLSSISSNLSEKKQRAEELHASLSARAFAGKL